MTAERFNEIFDDFEYLLFDGKYHYYKCRTCGRVKRATSHHISERSRIKCSCKREPKQKPKPKRFCPECGKELSKGKRLCVDCLQEHKRQARKTRKRLREAKALTNGRVDWGITLDYLIERDKGVCALCGKPIALNDYYITEQGYFVAGENYPSIDHITPLSKGGTHQKENIQLAHRGCNAKKGNKA